MHVLLETADGRGQFTASDELSDPEWGQVESWIRSLDGSLRSSIQIHRELREYLEIAHTDTAFGPRGYVLTAYVGGCSLVGKSQIGDEPRNGMVVVRHDEVPAQLSVNLEEALAAARLFFAEGQLEPALDWTDTSELDL